MKFADRALAILCIGALAGCAAEASAPQPEPGTAKLWTPAAISTPGYESSPTFTPDGRTMFFLSADKDFQNYRLMESRCEKGGWSAPVPPSFAMPLPVIEADPFVSPDGKRLYYISSRHAPAKEDFDIWYVERSAAGGWGEPQRLPEPVNSPAAELLPRVDAGGRLIFGSSRDGSAGGGDITPRPKPGRANGQSTRSVRRSAPTPTTMRPKFPAMDRR
jgi:Tol biopolymer transport system component